MIHGGYHRLYGLAVGERQNCDLRTGHEFLDNYLAAGFSELAVKQHGLYSRLSLFKILRDDNALAERQTVALDNSRVAVLRLYVLDCLVSVGEGLVARSGDTVLLHQRL